ncbi:MAG: DUF4197 domain-containing protein [Sphingobacteriaceae bacterium]|nr:DUF4197 domain-containing protein [Sphingobacteriaceae bacterium]
MKKLIFLLSLLCTFSIYSQSLKDKLKLKKDSLEKKTKTILKKDDTPKLTNEDVINGLKEALSIGTNNSSSLASKVDGYYKNPRLFIPWPEEAKDMRAKLLKMGMEKKIKEFETSLNRAAEEAAKKAAPVFTNAIVKMSVSDGFAILKGSDTAATNYLRKTTYSPLETEFLPIVKEAINTVKVTSYWNPLVTTYNKLPGVKKQNPDLDKYVTNKAINGLMILISDEEVKIRKDPMARVTDLLKKVFGKKEP